MTSGPNLKSGASRPTVNPATLSLTNYAALQRYIYAESGIVIEDGKQYLLEMRLLPILREHSIESLDALAVRLGTKPATPLARRVIEAMTTNETLFFRDPAMFDALRQHVLPDLFAGPGRSRKLRIWSAASSTGQEAYSIAMLLLEMGKTGKDVEILGTDLSTQVLERARTGIYAQFEVSRGLPATLLMKYFVRCGLDWQLGEQVRSMVQFKPLDLRHDFRSLGAFDLILCRNVLIYFDPPTKTKIVDSVRALLAPGAMLILGCAETVLNIHGGFKRVTFGTSAFYVPA